MSFQYEEVLCPECNGKMISRKSQHGIFWGCKDYPRCTGTRDNMGRSKADRAKEKGEGTMYEDDKGITNIIETNKFSFKKTR
jgi:ssDNA-binding Zn-finger/Zn-ribbon topoisomerase 1